MSLFISITHHLSDTLLLQLAEASAMPLAAARQCAEMAVPALVQQLTQPTTADERDARWDMCRQLYISQLLTEADELLRVDLGWPDRRRYLSQKILGPTLIATLTEASAQPAQAATLLGYLTIVALALVGEHAAMAGLDPSSLGAWLLQQKVPAKAMRQVAPGLQPVLRGASAARPLASSQKIKVLSTLGVLSVVGLVGGYFLLGLPANATGQAAQATPAEIEVAAPAATEPVVLAAAATALAAPAEAAETVPLAETPPPAAAVPAKVAAASAATHSVASKAVLRDTVGNAALARHIGGRFNAALGRYPKGEGQPLLVKLANRATLTVGINSTESLLYKRLTKPDLPRPNDIVLDRLTFDAGKARLGAEGAQQLGNVASLLKTFPKARLLVVGHANPHETQAIRLGLQRATAAVDELVKQGISADRLQAQGMLATELPTDSDSAEKQALLQGISLKMSRL